jgi:transcriptional regulator with PAS, ATPase and Fis domain
MNNIRRSCCPPRKELKILPQSPTLPYSFEEDINLKGLFDIISPENNLVLADDMMLSDARGVILRVSETYEKNFGFAHNSIVGRSAFDLEADGTFSPCITADVIRQKRKITATQTINHLHKNVMTVGIPLFDAAGELKYVMCFNTVSMEQINSIQRNYRRLQDSLQQYSQEIAELRTRSTATSLVFKSAPMQRLWTLMQNTANTRANILITGETGVGKSAVAKAIHAMSNRAAGPFIEVNCAVLHENLIESELFGYEKGAFTGAASSGKIGKIELANHGTLFLDEIGELPPHIQSKLLQLIQEKTIERLSGTRKIELDFRLLVATNRDLEDAVRRGLFRSDLFYRLNVIRIHIPPLRRRQEDILPLAHQFLSRFSEEYGKVLSLSPRFMSFLEQYSWPGNVRQLENLMERMAITVQDPVIDVIHLPPEYAGETIPHVPLPAQTGTLPERMDAYEGQIIRESYSRCGTTVAVARELGISQATAARKIAKYTGKGSRP